jgi:hypothetical protein
MSRFRFVAFVLISVLICGIVITVHDLFLIKVRLDKLHWWAENSHSFMAPIMIEIVESKLYQKQMILTGLMGLTALTIVSLMLIRRKLSGKAARDKRISPNFMAIFLMFVLLTLTVTRLTVNAQGERLR